MRALFSRVKHFKARVELFQFSRNFQGISRNPCNLLMKFFMGKIKGYVLTSTTSDLITLGTGTQLDYISLVYSLINKKEEGAQSLHLRTQFQSTSNEGYLLRTQFSNILLKTAHSLLRGRNQCGCCGRPGTHGFFSSIKKTY